MTQYFCADNEIIIPDKKIYENRAVIRANNGYGTGLINPRETEHIFIINPRSFLRKSEMEAVIAGIEGNMRGNAGIRRKIHISRYPRDAIGAVNRYVGNMPERRPIRVYAVGGDGILFDCLNAVMGIEDAELAVVPFGRENAFIRAFGEGVEELFRDTAKQMSASSAPTDVILCNGQYAINYCAIGLESVTFLRKSRYWKRIMRFRNLYKKLERNIYHFSVMVCALGEKNKNRSYNIFADGKKFDGLYTTMHIANGPCFGINLTPAGDSLPDDGRLEFSAGFARSSFAVMRLLNDIGYSRYLSGSYKNGAAFLRSPVREIEIASDDIMDVNLDGEMFYEKSVDIKIIPGGVRVVAPDGVRYTQRKQRSLM